jgi:hypothetical protein
MKYAAFRGTCSMCGWDHRIRADGTIWNHRAPEPEYADEAGNCRGSKKYPYLEIEPPKQS